MNLNFEIEIIESNDKKVKIVLLTRKKDKYEVWKQFKSPAQLGKIIGKYARDVYLGENSKRKNKTK